MKPMKVVAVVGASVLSLAVAVVLFGIVSSWIESVVEDTPVCSADKFEIESHSARSEGVRIIVTAAVRNNNPVACGVQVSVAVKDKVGKQVTVEPLWVGGVTNIPAGTSYTFPVYLSPEVSKDAEGGDFDIRPINSRVWKEQ